MTSLHESMPGLIEPGEFLAELESIKAESIGWFPLGTGAYLHVGDPEAIEVVVSVTGIPDAGMAGMNVLLLVG